MEGLAGVCAGLGCASHDPAVAVCYIKGDHCLDNLKNLQRFLRRDHPTGRPVFKQLGKWNTVGQDLVPIIVQYRNDPELVINAVKVVVFLTMPVDTLSDGLSEQMEYLWNFKASFLSNDAIAVIVTLLEEPLEHLESDAFSEDDWKVVQLVLTLVRNLLDIQDLPTQTVKSSKVQTIRDELLELLFQENVIDLLVALAHHVAGSHGHLRQDSLLFLEIFHHIFWGQSPEKIAGTDEANCKDEHSKSPSRLLRTMMEEEKEQLKHIRLKSSSRPSWFSGTFVRMAEDGSKKVLKRNPFQSSIESVLMGPRFKHGAVKRIACDRSSFPASQSKVIELLRIFADQILAGAYNVVMQSVKDVIDREQSGVQSADVTLFFQVAKFFTAYQRYRISDLKSKGFSNLPHLETDELFQGQLCGPIASTMDEHMFRMVVSRWQEFSESAKETNDWIPLSVTGTLFKEMIRMLDLVLQVAQSASKEEEQEARVARILLYKVFYDQTDKGIIKFLLHLLKTFDIHKQPRSHLAYLFETVHVVLRILEVLTNADGALWVLKKSRKSNKKKIKETDPGFGQAHKDNIDKSPSSGIKSANMADSDAHADFSTAVGGPSNESVLGEVSRSEEQLVDVQRESIIAEHSGTAEMAGKSDSDMRHEEDTDATEPPIELNMPHSSAKEEKGAEQEGVDHHVEVSLDVRKSTALFADNTVVRNYCWLLKYYDSNSAATNYYIICMLHRICKDHFLEPMLYQLSFFQIFYEILSNRKASKSEEHAKLFAFLTKLLRNFFKRLKVQPLLFLDILFWKTRQDCHLISHDYEIHSLRRLAGKKCGKVTHKKTIADALGNDEFDADCPPFEVSKDECRNKGKVPQLLEKSDSLKFERRKKNGLFTAEQEAQLKELFEEHKEDPKCCLLLAQTINSEGKITAAQVGRKLKLLGLIPLRQRSQPRKQLDHGKNSKCMKQKGIEKRISKSDRGGEALVSDVQESDDETLTQMMKKVRRSNIGGSEHSEKNVRSQKKDAKLADLKVKRKRVEVSEEETSDDETIQVLLTKRKTKLVDINGNNLKDGGLLKSSSGTRKRGVIRKVGGRESRDDDLEAASATAALEDDLDDDDHDQQELDIERRRRNMFVVVDE